MPLKIGYLGAAVMSGGGSERSMVSASGPV